MSLATTISLAKVVDEVHNKCKLKFIIKFGYAIAFRGTLTCFFGVLAIPMDIIKRDIGPPVKRWQ